MPGIIAVHCGAGHHGRRDHIRYNKLSKKACRIGVNLLKQGVDSLQVLKEVISVLEDDPLTNAGYGSNLTLNGYVEQDASIMSGKHLIYGGCGAVKKIKNPIQLAYNLCRNQIDLIEQNNDGKLQLGLIPPNLLVGNGALQYAKEIGLKIYPNHRSLISLKAARQYRKYKNLYDIVNDNKPPLKLDTIGAVCVDNNGCIAAGCSSGGIILKRPGRIGQAALYGCGTWAENNPINQPDTPSIAVCTSGCGEYITQTHLAKQICDDLKKSTCPTLGLNQSMTDHFLNSRYLCNIKEKLVGALVLYIGSNNDAVVLWGHNTETMSVGFMSTNDEKPNSLISTLPKDIQIGTTINVSGSYFSITD